MRRSMTVATLLGLAACSGAPQERGWIGGKLRVVPGDGPALLPASASVPRALLVVGCDSETPLARAGVRVGDFILFFNGKPVPDPLDFRREVEKAIPGRTVTLEVWRAGRFQPLEVKVGREVFVRRYSIGLGLFFDTDADLWPFDDGFNVFGLVRVQADPRRHDVAEEYRGIERNEGKPVSMPVQERTRVQLTPFMFESAIVVERQEAVP